jgi:hypothetical protein
MTPVEAEDIALVLHRVYGDAEVMRTLARWPHAALDEAVTWWIGEHPHDAPQATQLIERMQERARASAANLSAPAHVRGRDAYSSRADDRGSRRRGALCARIVNGLARGNADDRKALAGLHFPTMTTAELESWARTAMVVRAAHTSDLSEADVELMVASALDDLPTDDEEF